MYHAHVQHPLGSGYMMASGKFETVQDAVTEYLRLVDADGNPFGRNALIHSPLPIKVLLIPAELHGPDIMAYTGFCNVWDENGDDMYETEQPEYISVPNPRYVA